jgi:cytochrome P450
VTTTVDFPLDLDQMHVDPYPTYAEMRRRAPVAYVPDLNLWMVTRWVDVETVAGQRERWGSPASLGRLNRTFGEPNVLTANGEEHAMQRIGIDAVLRPRAVNTYVEELIRPLAKKLIEALRPAGEAELVDQYLEPLSVLGLGSLLSLGELDADTLRRWFKEMQAGSGNTAGDPAGFAVSDNAIAEIEATVDPILDRLETSPDESLLSHMLFSGRPEGSPRPRSEIYPSYCIVISGGMREPSHAGASTLLGLLSNRDQLELVLADKAIVPRAIVEGLRWISPIAQAVRSPFEDTELAGVEIPAGSIVNAVLAAANRDEDKFDRPDEFDLTRSPNAHMSFGQGAHFCAGNFFARQLLRIGLEELLAAFPAIRLEREPEVRGFMFRAPVELRVSW